MKIEEKSFFRMNNRKLPICFQIRHKLDNSFNSNLLAQDKEQNVLCHLSRYFLRFFVIYSNFLRISYEGMSSSHCLVAIKTPSISCLSADITVHKTMNVSSLRLFFAGIMHANLAALEWTNHSAAFEAPRKSWVAYVILTMQNVTVMVWRCPVSLTGNCR